jgi:TatD DNase family protein
VDYGCYFSINAEMLRNVKHRTLIAGLPLDRLLTETDGPFVESDGRRSRPRDVSITVAQLAEVRNVTFAEMAKLILDNLRKLVS